MDLNQLVVFVRVMDARSFTKAARFLKQPKSRVSRKIATLERELGTSLLYRTTRQFRPTEAGLALYQKCKDHIYALEGASEFTREGSQKVSGVIRVSAAQDMGTALLGPVIDELTRLYPDVAVDLQLSNEMVDLVREGFDLSIRIGELEDTTLKARRIGQVASILVASPDYIARAPRIEAPADLSHHPVLDFGFSEDEENLWRIKTSGKREEKIRVKPICRTNNPQILVELACLGKGVALIPAFLCIDAIREGKLIRVLAGSSSGDGPVSFVWPSQKDLSPKVRAFVEVGMRHLMAYF